MAIDRLLISVKRGTPECSTLLRNVWGVQHLQICDFVWADQRLVDKLNNDPEATKAGMSAYQYMAVPLGWEAKIRELMEPVVEGEEEKQGRLAWFDQTAFLKKVGCTEAELLNGRKRAIIDASQWDLTDGALVKRCDVDGPYVAADVIDRAAITSGTHTENAGGGGDYLTVASAWGDVTHLTGAMELQQDSAITETSGALISKDNNGHEFKQTCNSYHNGDPTAGYKLTLNHTSIGLDERFYDVGDVIIEKLNIVRSQAGGVINVQSQGSVRTSKVRQILIDLAGLAGNGIETKHSNLATQIYLCKIWGGSNGGYAAIYTGAASGSSVIENNSIYFNDYGIHAGGQAITIRNNAAIRTGSRNCYFQIASADGYNNCDSDASGENADFSTGSGNVSNLSTAIWTSVDDTSSDFLTPVASSGIDGAATTPTLWSTDIAGNPYAGTIGAQQIAVSALNLGAYHAQQFEGPFQPGAWR